MPPKPVVIVKTVRANPDGLAQAGKVLFQQARGTELCAKKGARTQYEAWKWQFQESRWIFFQLNYRSSHRSGNALQPCLVPRIG